MPPAPLLPETLHSGQPPFISTTSSATGELLYSRGILEVIIYPNMPLATRDVVKIGSIAFLDDNHCTYEEVSSWILFHLYMLTFKLACNFTNIVLKMYTLMCFNAQP